MGQSRLNKYEKAQAKYTAIRLFGLMYTDVEVIAALQDEGMRPRLNQKQAEAVAKEAWKAVITDSDGVTADRARNQLLVSTRELFREARENKRYSAALGCLKQMARLYGLEKEERDKVGAKPVATGAELPVEFEGRTPEDLEFFAEHGCFPEDFRERKERPKEKDPLEALH